MQAMQVNVHFVFLEELPEIAPITSAGKNAMARVARIEIIRECQPGEVEFDDAASDVDPLT